MRISIYAIALNEIDNVDRFLRTCEGADTVVVADTGSTDGTQDALRRGGASTYSIAVQPWRFDDARNAALALVPPAIDVCIALDLDEVLVPGWRPLLERGWTPGTTLGRYRYVTSHLLDGSPAVVLSGAKIHRRFGYRWRHMCHEILVPDRLVRRQETWLADLQVDHWPELSKNRSGYLTLLEAENAEAPDDPRNLFLLGREYVFLERWDDGEAMLRRYLAAAGVRWPRQRATAWRRLARCRNGLRDSGGAIACLQEGLQIAPRMRDLWLDLADIHWAAENWRASYEAAGRGLALLLTPDNIANEAIHAGGRPFYRASLAACRLGRPAEAHALAVQASSRDPRHSVYRQHLSDLGTR